ncbi:MAG: universal stress protein [Methylococcales bacterium]|jgi:hypothetical protein|nr:universal stress protein [Methylococcales bacterium]MBT7443590.1 universal stress protein [Methylococcales bacterium]
MPQVDQFESVFRAAVKDVYVYEPVTLSQILLVTDLSEDEAHPYVEKVQQFVGQSSAQWRIIYGNECDTAESLLNFVESHQYDLICTYRNLHTAAWQFPHSLGDKLDVLLQKSSVPVLVLPHPKADYAADHAMESRKTVMAVTDHLSNDHCLVNYSAHFTAQSGKLFLAHIEDQLVFDRYIDAISKISTIDTDDATTRLHDRLLKMPADYVASCRQVLSSERSDIQVCDIVQFGHHLEEYRKHIEHERIDLLVMHAKDDDQLAMHGLAYPLAVELRQIPLLML